MKRKLPNDFYGIVASLWPGSPRDPAQISANLPKRNFTEIVRRITSK
jgi:multidrug resistance efflux pump